MEGCCVHTRKRAGSLQENFILCTSNGGCIGAMWAEENSLSAMTRIHWSFALVLNLFGTMELVLLADNSSFENAHWRKFKASCIRTHILECASHVHSRHASTPAQSSMNFYHSCTVWWIWSKNTPLKFTNYNHHTVSQKLDEEFTATCMYRSCICRKSFCVRADSHSSRRPDWFFGQWWSEECAWLCIVDRSQLTHHSITV